MGDGETGSSSAAKQFILLPLLLAHFTRHTKSQILSVRVD